MVKVDFVIAYNSGNINKCIECINNLYVPENVCIDTLGIEGENPVGEVYNACQEESTADYRVFIRENVYILNTNFISDVLSFFEANPSCEAAGIIGGVKNGRFIDWDCGAVNIVNEDRADRFVLEKSSGEVEVLSGQLIVLKCKADWSCEESKNFDIVFSERMGIDGKKLAVFKQPEPWCLWEYGGTYSERADVYDLEKGAFAYIGEEKPLVSVMIAIHNGADFMRDTIDSILKQTYRNLQIVLVDDCSTDDSAEIIKEYAEADERIVPVFLPKNRHICYAVNEAYSLATGKYIASIGHDDLCRPWKFEEQIAFMERFEKYAVCFTLCHIINDYQKIIDDRSEMTSLFEKKNTLKENWQRNLFWHGNCFCIPSAIIRKSMIPKGPLYKYDIVQLQDYDLWLRILNNGDIYILQEKITLYRHFEDGHTNLSNLGAESEMSPQRLKAMEEAKRIKAQYLMEIPNAEFIKTFSVDFKCKDSQTDLELLCEKAFFLLKLENRRFYDVISLIMRTEEGVKLLDEKYGFSTIDFYKQEEKYLL